MARIWAPILIILGAVVLFVGIFLPIAHYPAYSLKLIDFDHDPRSVWLYQMNWVIPTLAAGGAGVMAFYKRSSWLYAAIAGIMATQLLSGVGMFLGEAVNSNFWGHPQYGLILL